MIDTDKMRQLMQKLKDQGDISLKEADEIYSQENAKSFELKRVMEEWYEVVAEKIRKGLRGNFVFTIDLHKDLDFMEPAQDAIRKHGNFEDLCDFIQVDKRLYSLVPFKHLFVEAGKSPLFKNVEIYYEMNNSRAGIYYYPFKTATGTCTISHFMKRFYSIPAFSGINAGVTSKKFFEIAAGIYDIPLDFYSFRNVREIKHCILAEFMKRKNIPCIVATALYDNKSILFIEEENAIAVKRTMETSLEKLVRNALDKNAIDEKAAKVLLVDGLVPHFSFDKFAEASFEYLDETNETKIKMMRDIAEEENEWLEEIR